MTIEPDLSGHSDNQSKVGTVLRASHLPSLCPGFKSPCWCDHSWNLEWEFLGFNLGLRESLSFTSNFKDLFGFNLWPHWYLPGPSHFWWNQFRLFSKLTTRRYCLPAKHAPSDNWIITKSLKYWPWLIDKLFAMIYLIMHRSTDSKLQHYAHLAGGCWSFELIGA